MAAPHLDLSAHLGCRRNISAHSQVSVGTGRGNEGRTGVGLGSMSGCHLSVTLFPRFPQTTSGYIADLGRFGV